jgi:hypothetical protein
MRAGCSRSSTRADTTARRLLLPPEEGAWGEPPSRIEVTTRLWRSQPDLKGFKTSVQARIRVLTPFRTFNLTRERIRQIENRSLNRLQVLARIEKLDRGL